MDVVIFQLYDNADTMILALKAGEIDMVYGYAAGVDVTVIESLKQSGNLTLQALTSAGSPATLVFNCNQAPFDNVLIRKAVAAGIDYEAFARTFGSEFSAIPNASFVSPANIGFAETKKMECNLDMARGYLQEAGCEDSDGDGFYEYNGQPLSFELLVRSDRAVQVRYAEMVKLNMEALGVKVNVNAVETAVYQEITQQTRAEQATIVNLTAYGMTMDAGLGTLYLYADNRMSYGQVYDGEFVAQVDRLAASENLDAYLENARTVQEWYAENVPAIALLWDSPVQAYSSRLTGFQVDGTFGILNVPTWYSISEN